VQFLVFASQTLSFGRRFQVATTVFMLEMKCTGYWWWLCV